MSRAMTFHVFCSVKGGVGKSTLAVACAKLLARAGRVPVLIDADLTGTSIADGLRLCAPKSATRRDGSLDLDAPPTGQLHDLLETEALRRARRGRAPQDRPPPPVFLNDAINYVGRSEGMECRVDAMLWRHESDDGVLYLPSSPLRRDVEQCLDWLYGETPFAWVARLVWVLDALLEQRSDVTDLPKLWPRR